MKRLLGILYLAGLFIFIVLHHLYAYQGHFGYDDMWYAKLAKQITDGSFSLSNDHYAYRWIPIFFTALSYKLLGVSDHASALAPLLTTFFTCALILFFYRKNQWIAILAVTFYALYYWVLYYSDKLMPDIYVATFLFTAISALYYHRFPSSGKHSFLFAGIFSASLCLGFLAKETISFGGPIVFAIFLSDVFQKRFIRFWICSAGVIGLLAVLYFGCIYSITGNVLERFHAISAGSYLNPCSYNMLPVSAVLKRISFELGLVFIRSGLALAILFTIPNARMGLKKLLAVKESDAFWTTVSLTGLLASNFMSTSLTGYVPMCPDARHFLFMAPLLAMAAGPVAYNYVTTGSNKFFILCGSAILFAISYAYDHEFTFYTYLPFFILALLRFVPFTQRRALFYFLFVAVLFTPSLFAYSYSKKNNYFTQKQVVEEHFRNNTDKNIVITDDVQRNLAEYHIAFDSTYTRFITFKEAPSEKFEKEVNVYVLLNGYTRYLSKVVFDSLPGYVKNLPPATQKLYDYDDVLLYKLPPQD